MTKEERQKLDEALRLLSEVEQSMGENIEETVAYAGNAGRSTLMFQSLELGTVIAAKAALESLGRSR